MQKAFEQPSQLVTAACLQPSSFAHCFRVEEDVMCVVMRIRESEKKKNEVDKNHAIKSIKKEMRKEVVCYCNDRTQQNV
jgi:hypothetical protein